MDRKLTVGCCLVVASYSFEWSLHSWTWVVASGFQVYPVGHIPIIPFHRWDEKAGL